MPPQTRRKQKIQKQKLEKEKSANNQNQKTSQKGGEEIAQKELLEKLKQSQQELNIQTIKNNTKQEEEEVKINHKKDKKHRKKTYEQQLRINKSKYQRIFLLSAQRNDDHWHFLVQGTKGSQYHVNVSTEVKCTCMDFRLKQNPCKHIYFIVTQVGQNDQLLDYFKNSKKISNKAYKKLDQQLSNRLKNRLEKPSKQAKDIDLKDDKDCVICFTQMEKQTEPLQDCSTCKKYFHTQCISAWKNHNPSCPLCRGALTGGTNDNDPLGKLLDIKL